MFIQFNSNPRPTNYVGLRLATKQGERKKLKVSDASSPRRPPLGAKGGSSNRFSQCEIKLGDANMSLRKYDYITSQEYDDVLEVIIVEDDEIAANPELEAITNEMEEPHVAYSTCVDTMLKFDNAYWRFLDYQPD